MPRLIGIRGLAGHGKDTVANFIVEYLSPSLIRKVWFAEPLKEMVSIITGLPVDTINADKNRFLPEYNMTLRTLMQKVGTDALRNQVHPDIWIHIANRRIQQVPENQVVVIPDVRFENEIRYIRENKGIILSVYRPNVGEAMNHESELGQLAIRDVDYEIVNDGSVMDLQRKVFSLMGKMFPTYSTV